MGRQHQNAARTRARCAEARRVIQNGRGEWVRLPDLGTLDRMKLSRDMSLEFRMVHTGGGLYVYEARVNETRVAEYESLMKRFHEAFRESGKGPRQRAAFEAINADVSAFSEPRRLG